MLRPYFSRVFLLGLALSIIPSAAVAQRDGGGAAIPLPAFSEKGFFGAERDKTRRATPAEALRLPAGFQAELLYTVPLDTQGSWVCLCVDPRGRLIASAQSGGLYRITLPAPEDAQAELKVETLDTPIRGAQGLVCAFGSLYAVASNQESALYRLRDTDGDDRYDEVRLLRRIEGDGEHGPHAVVAGPDGQSLYVVGGNGSQLSELPESSRYPGEPREDGCSVGSARPTASSPPLAPAAGSAAPIPKGAPSSRSPSDCAMPMTWRSAATASCSRSTLTWSGTWALPGIDRRGSATS